MRGHSVFAKALGEKFFVLVAARKANHVGLRSEPGDIHGHIGRATGLLAVVLGAHHRHRRFRRDASHLTPDVFIEHDVAHHKQAF